MEEKGEGKRESGREKKTEHTHNWMSVRSTARPMPARALSLALFIF